MVVSGGASPICETRVTALQPPSAARLIKARERSEDTGEFMACLLVSTGGDERASVDDDGVGAGDVGVDDATRFGVGDMHGRAHGAILEGAALGREAHGRRLEND